MKTFTITLKNNEPSTVADILKTADGFTAAISNVFKGEKDVLFTRTYKTYNGAYKYVQAYKREKQRQFNEGELVEGVTVFPEVI